MPDSALVSAPPGTAVFAFTRHPVLSKQRVGRDEELAGRASSGLSPLPPPHARPRCKRCSENGRLQGGESR